MALTETMKQRREREKIPVVLLRAVLVLVLSALLIVSYAVVTDRPLEAMPPTDTPVFKEREIILSGSMNGAAEVMDVNGTVIASLTPDKGGFIAGVYRVLVRERNKHGVDIHAPIRLVRFADGRLSLRDAHTGWRAELIGFGRDNEAAFSRLLD